MRKDLTISQVATTGTNALQITGGIAGSTTAANKTVTFAGPGAINVSGAAIANGTGGGTMALNVTGGTTILANANTYSGGTTLSAGDLRVANASGLGTGTLSQVSGASTLQFSNADTVTNTMSVYNVAFLTGGNNLSGRVTNNSATYDVAAGTTNTISGYMTGPGGVVKTGEGVLSVTGATNDYASGTTIANGTLRGGNDSAFGTGVLQMNGGAISSDSAAARNFANPLTLGGDATFGQSSGGTGSLTFSSTATNNLGGGTRTLTTVVDTKIDGAFGNGSLTKAGAGTLYLSNASSSFGTLTINAGRITFQTNASITGLDGAGGSLQIAGGTLTVNLATNATYSDSISGSGSLAKTGTGTLTLGVANTFAGGTTLSDGVLRVSDTAGLGTGALIQTSGASTVQFSNAGTVANNMSVYNVAFLTGGNNLSGLITNNNATYDVAAGTTNTLSGFVTGSGGLTKTGEGVLSVTGTTNDYAGATTISNGTLRVTTLADAGAVSSIGTNATVNFSGTNASTTVLDYTGGNVTTDRSLVFNGVATNGEGGTLRVSNSSTVVTLDGAASGTGRMIVDGGTVVLSNTTTGNSFAPASIQVNSNSILQIAANEQIGNSTDLILNGGTLRLFNGTTGYAETLGTLTLSASSTIDLGAATTLRNITFANSSAITWTGTLTITNWQGVANTTGDAGRLLFGSGGLTSGQMSQVYWAGPGFTGSGGALIGPNGELVPIPEPRVYAAAIALLAAVGWRERRRILSLVNLKAKPRA
jgi:fibronectin-binding autotransporter adhesin